MNTLFERIQKASSLKQTEIRSGRRDIYLLTYKLNGQTRLKTNFGMDLKTFSPLNFTNTL